MHGALMAYGDIALHDRFLRQFITTDRGDGRLQMVFPRDNPTNHCHPQFLLQWSTRIREHYEYIGRRTLVDQTYPSVRRLNDWFEPYRGDMGLLRDIPENQWMDWTPVDLRGANFSTNALYVNSLEDGAWLAAQMGREDDRARWQRIADEVRAALRRHFWNPDLGVFEDSHYRGELTGVTGELAQGFALLYGIATDEQAERMCESLAGRGTELFEASPLWYPYVLEGMLARGFGAEALRIIHNRYDWMMSAHENPTLWEGWDPFTAGSAIKTDADFGLRHTAHKVRPAGVRSLVHSGGVYVGWVLSTQVLGVRAAAPGMSHLRVHPARATWPGRAARFPFPAATCGSNGAAAPARRRSRSTCPTATRRTWCWTAPATRIGSPGTTDSAWKRQPPARRSRSPLAPAGTRSSWVRGNWNAGEHSMDARAGARRTSIGDNGAVIRGLIASRRTGSAPRFRIRLGTAVSQVGPRAPHPAGSGKVARFPLPQGEG